VSKVRRVTRQRVKWPPGRANEPPLLSRQQPEQGFYQLHGKMIRFRGMEWGNPLAGWFVVSVPD